MIERDLQDAIIEAARLFGWRVAHFRVAKTKHGWRTPVAADGAGFPDLVLVRGSRLIFAELKGDGGRVRPEQDLWLDALSLVASEVEMAVADSNLRDLTEPYAPSVEVFLWRPDDWTSGRIDAVLTHNTKEREIA